MADRVAKEHAAPTALEREKGQGSRAAPQEMHLGRNPYEALGPPHGCWRGDGR